MKSTCGWLRWSHQMSAGRMTFRRSSSSTSPCIWPVSPTPRTELPSIPRFAEYALNRDLPGSPPVIGRLLGPQRPQHAHLFVRRYKRITWMSSGIDQEGAGSAGAYVKS